MKKLLAYLICLSLLLSACSSGKSNKASNFTTRPEVEGDELTEEPIREEEKERPYTPPPPPPHALR